MNGAWNWLREYINFKHEQGIPMIKKSILWMFLGLLFWAIPFAAGAETPYFHNGLSLQGYTGLLNAPNAVVTDEGRGYLLFSDQMERHRRRLQDSAENYMFSIGLLPNFEIGARLTEEHPNGMRDLSANLKFRVPRFFDHPYIPDLAFGIQDVGGGSTHLETKYGVLSKTIGPLRLSLGLGLGPDRLDGIFGGAEVRLFDWLYLLGEYDTEEANVGIRAFTPDDLFPIPVNLGFIAKTSLEHKAGEFDLAAVLQFPLGLGRYEGERLPEELGPSGDGEKQFLGRSLKADSDDKGEAEDEFELLEAPVAAVPDLAEPMDAPIQDIKDTLVDLGFENVRAGVLGEDGLYVEYENNRYNHNELDGLGLVMGVSAHKAPVSLKSMTVVLKRHKIPMMAVSVSVGACREFLTPVKVSMKRKAEFESGIMVSRHTDFAGNVRFVGKRLNSSLFRPRLAIYPHLFSFLGTESGVYSYLLSIRPDLRLPVWKGGEINLRYNIPAVWHERFDDGGIYDHLREDPKMDRLMFNQAFKLHSDVTTQVNGGFYRYGWRDNVGMFNETFWTPGDGRHRVGLKLGYFHDNDEDFNREVWLASYRYYMSRWDLFLEGTYGRFWHEDRGVMVTAKRFFGDVAVDLFYRHVGTGTGDRAAGLRVSLPLTLRRDMKPRKYGQVLGDRHWSYGHQTAVATEGQRNPVTTTLAVIPVTERDLGPAYYDNDRLNERYVRAHIMRLRAAYQKWGLDEEDKNFPTPQTQTSPPMQSR